MISISQNQPRFPLQGSGHSFDDGKKPPISPLNPIASRKSAQLDFSGALVNLEGNTTGPQHGKSPPVKSVNSRISMQPSQPSGVTIVNGAPAQGDHSRKPSVTISSAGTSGYIPNGGPAGSARIQFGDLPQSPSTQAISSPAPQATQPQSNNLGVSPSPSNPRVPSPQDPPSPIPQHSSSGGRPPSSFQYQGNNMNMSFGSMNSGEDRQIRPNQAPLGPGPQPSHLRRESSQSAHSDMSGHMVTGPGGPNRGGYSHQSGRGRGYSQSGYQGQMAYSPSPSFRPSPNPPRGGHNMGPQFHGHNPGRASMVPPFPNSPHQSTRSPALANAHPVTPQMNQVPMAHPMPAQHYGGYNQHMGPQTNYQHGYDPNYPYYNPAYGVSQMQYMTPPSPQTRPGAPYNPQATFMPNQYPPVVQPTTQGTPLSRTPSQVSNERPGSSLGHGQGQPPSGPAVSGHAHASSRSSNSPAPTKSQFVIPPTKKSVIVIKDPSGAIKNFEKQPASPARATPSPVAAQTPTPPPPARTPSRSEHVRSDSKSTKTAEEKRQELRDAVLLKVQQEDAERRRKQDEEAAEAQKAMEQLSLKDEGSTVDTKSTEPSVKTEDVKPVVTEPATNAVQDSTPASTEVAMSEPAPTKPAEAPVEKVSPSAPASAPAAAADDEIDIDALEREMAEIEAKEAAAEAEYQRKKQAQKEEEERKKREEQEAYERNMKNAEREAEAAEEARLKKLEAGGAETSTKDLFATLKRGGSGTPATPATDSPAAHSPGDSGTSTPVSDMGPPAKPSATGSKRDKPSALKLDTNKPVEPPQPSAAMKSLQSARRLHDLAAVTYPPSIVSPNPALNVNAPSDRKFKYNKEFLLQFQNVFRDKPSVDWDDHVRETMGDGTDSARPASARTPAMGVRQSSRSGMQPAGFPTVMGSFNATPMGRSSSMAGGASMPGRVGPMPNPFQFGGRPPSMGPSVSRPGSNPNMAQSPRPSGSRGPGRQGSSKPKKKEDEQQNQKMPLTAGMDLKPLATSTTGWKPRSVGQPTAGPTPAGEGHLPPDVVQRKVKANLNKMTPDNFDRISEQILAIVSQSKDESDGRTLRQVIQLTFEKATDEAHWAPMYAKFCKRMLESMSPEIKDENIRDKNGNVVTGGSLFRKYLLNRCQEEFERGWKINLPEKPEGDTAEAVLMSDEYYKAAAAKRRGLGLVKFIGELYKLGMLTERIMHECVKKLVDYEGIPDEAEVESLTSLLRTIGASLDASEKGPAMMDAYFGRISMMIETPGLPSRLRFMLMDVVDLRNAGWRSKDADKGPKTITEIREEAARAQHEAEMERLRQQANRGGNRMPLGRGDARNMSGDYRNQVPPPDYAGSKVGTDDLRRLKNARTVQPMSFGPSSMFGSRSSSGRKNLGPGGNLVRGGEDSGASSRTGTPPAGKKDDKEPTSSVNAFSALASLEDRDNLATSPPSDPSSPPMTKSRPAIERSKSPGKEGESAV